MTNYWKAIVFTLFIVGLILLFFVRPSNALEGTSTELTENVIIQQNEITENGTVILPVTVNLNSEERRTRPTRVMVCASIRWLSLDNHTTRGDRVAIIRINGITKGVFMMADSGPEMLWQFSSSACYSEVLNPGIYHVDLLVGGCCYEYGHPFVVGQGSRIDIIW